MAQTTFNNGESGASIRTKLNNNATEAENRLHQLEQNQNSQTLDSVLEKGNSAPAKDMEVQNAIMQKLKLKNGASIVNLWLITIAPENNVVGSVGDIAISTNGNIYQKKSGTNTNTGWQVLSVAQKTVQTITTNVTPSVNCDNYHTLRITAQNANITSASITGTPTDGQTMQFQITGTGTFTIAWGASFEASSVALPTQITTTRQDVLFQYNASNSKWRCIGVV